MPDSRDLMLPLFEGERPSESVTKITGKADQPVRALGMDEEVLLVVKGTVSGINHKRANGGYLQREQTVTAEEIHVLDGVEQDTAERLLAAAQATARRLREHAEGVTPLFPEASIPDRQGE